VPGTAAASSSSNSSGSSGSSSSSRSSSNAGQVPLELPLMRQAIAWQLCHRELMHQQIHRAADLLKRELKADDVRDLRVSAAAVSARVGCLTVIVCCAGTYALPRVACQVLLSVEHPASIPACEGPSQLACAVVTLVIRCCLSCRCACASTAGQPAWATFLRTTYSMCMGRSTHPPVLTLCRPGTTR
jgi:hypothetical protein